MHVSDIKPILSPKNISTEYLQDYVDAIVDEYALPALSVAIWHQGKLYHASTGILNVETQVPATSDSVFQVGSIAKVFTATLIMQLVDKGSINLEKPVKHYLRDFQVADKNTTDNLTVRQLLNHTSGLAGDFFPEDAVTGGNPIARYVDRCCLLPQVHVLGERHSYSNAAYSIAGRLIEVVIGASWFKAIEENIIIPLGLSHTFADPLKASRFRVAMGHFPDDNNAQQWTLAPSTYLPLGQAPAGTTLSMSASDLITFARAHMQQGRIKSSAKGGSRGENRWLSASAVAGMQTSNIALPPYAPMFISDWGIGWCLSNQYPHPIIGHDGATLGQMSTMRIVPELDCAFVALTNGARVGLLQRLVTDLMAGLTEMQFKLPKPRASLSDNDRFTGTFESFDSLIKIANDSEHLVASVIQKIPPSQPKKLMLKPLNQGTVFALFSESGERAGSVAFLNIDKLGTPQDLYYGLRIHQRIES